MLRQLIIAMLVVATVIVASAFLGRHIGNVLLPRARCASCPDWPCMAATHCGGSMSSGCMCLKRAHEQLGVCVSKAYAESSFERAHP